MDWEDAKKMLGSYGPWPENSPPQLVKQYVNSSDSVIPETFDARLKWPDSIHPIQNQVRYCQIAISQRAKTLGMTENQENDPKFIVISFVSI